MFSSTIDASKIADIPVVVRENGLPVIDFTIRGASTPLPKVECGDLPRGGKPLEEWQGILRRRGYSVQPVRAYPVTDLSSISTTTLPSYVIEPRARPPRR